MKPNITWQAMLVAALVGAGCASSGEKKQAAHPVEGVRKVIDSLVGEATQRSKSDPFRGLPIVVQTTSASSGGLESITAEFLRTRLVAGGVAVNAVCGARCTEMTLQEMTTEAPKGPGFTPGQIISAGSSYVPVVGGLIRSISEREQEKAKAASRITWLIVTFAARDGDR